MQSENKQLAQRKKIEGTPFYMIKQTTDNDKDRYFLVMGDYRLTEPTDTEEETVQKLKSEHWNIVCNIIAITTNKIMNIKTESLYDEYRPNHDKMPEQEPYKLESL